MTRDDLISADYLQEQRILHAAPKGYGGKGDKWADTVIRLLEADGCASMLDYGCGQGTLAQALRDARIADNFLDIREYDPAIRGKDAMPSPADIVVCTDVIEHIEPAKLDAVLMHLASLAEKALFVVIATRPASKFLSDGRNAHLIVEDASWWEAKLLSLGFTVVGRPESPSHKPSREFVAVLSWSKPAA